MKVLRKIESWLFVILLFGVLGRGAVFAAVSEKAAGKKDPHKDDIQSFQPGCLACHSSDPLKQNQGADTVDFEKCRDQCSGCHAIPQSCLAISTRKATEILKSQLHYIGLPLLSESIACGSCHIFHDKGHQAAGDHRLNSLYANFWSRAQLTDPHRANIFCQLCHEGDPVKPQAAGIKLPLKADGVAVCIQCHDGKKARADNHPVKVTPTKEKGVNVPANFPLSDGKTTCLTCHMMPCQGGKVEGNLLRGGPYEKRVDICLTCHMKERYQAVNPHIQVDEKGHIIKTKCLYCHII